MRLVLVGPPGSGKGTQAKRLCSQRNLRYIGTGEILREAVRQDTSVGRAATPYLLDGKLVPDTIVNDVVAELFHRELPTAFVADGYPRTVDQAIAFESLLAELHLDLTATINLQISDSDVVQRLSGRWVCPADKTVYHTLSKPPKIPGICDLDGTLLVQRDDDKELTIRKRLNVFHATVDDLVEYYREKGLLRDVPAVDSPDIIYRNILQAVDPS